MESIYENIRRLRESRGMSQDDLAELTGYVSRSSIAKIEKGLVDLQQSKIIAFANALGVSLSELMGIGDKEKFNVAYLHNEGYTPEEVHEIKKYAAFVKNNRREEPSKQHFTDVKEAIEYIKHETSAISAFNDGDTTKAEVILQVANAIYFNRKNT